MKLLEVVPLSHTEFLIEKGRNVPVTIYAENGRWYFHTIPHRPRNGLCLNITTWMGTVKLYHRGRIVEGYPVDKLTRN